MHCIKLRIGGFDGPPLHQKGSRVLTKSAYGRHRVSVQGVKSLGGHFACLCRGLNFMK